MSIPVAGHSKRRVDVVVVGAGPAGSIAALLLARGGAQVALIDKACFPRDKACGDLVGPRALALLAELGLDPPGGRPVGEMMIIGPTGRRVLLPACAGLSYPDHGLAISRHRFDHWLREAAIAAGAEPVNARVTALAGRSSVELDDGARVDADIVIGADGATSCIAEHAGLIDRRHVLWGFAYRGYTTQCVERPVIALWDETPRRGFPGYGWIFPNEDNTANVGLGLSLGAERVGASRAVANFEKFCDHLRRLDLLTGQVDGRHLGGWLKMGIVGTRPAHDRVLLVGDAAGLVNPLQGEGIAPAMTSAAAAAHAVLAGADGAASRYHDHITTHSGRHAAATTPLHVAVARSPRRTAVVGRALTLPGIGRVLARPWSLLWNDLLVGAPPGPNRTIVSAALAIARTFSQRSDTSRHLKRTLEPVSDERAVR